MVHCFLRVVFFFFHIQLDHFVPMIVKNVSNTCFAKTYYINRLTHKNCKRVTTNNPTAQLTNELIFCSHVILAPIAGAVNYIFLSSNMLSISFHITELKLKNLNKNTVLTSTESINRTMKKMLGK
jgi:hypothetical protein